jgi:hypothetical protein
MGSDYDEGEVDAFLERAAQQFRNPQAAGGLTADDIHNVAFTSRRRRRWYERSSRPSTRGWKYFSISFQVIALRLAQAATHPGAPCPVQRKGCTFGNKHPEDHRPDCLNGK